MRSRGEPAPHCCSNEIGLADVFVDRVLGLPAVLNDDVHVFRGHGEHIVRIRQHDGGNVKRAVVRGRDGVLRSGVLAIAEHIGRDNTGFVAERKAAIDGHGLRAFDDSLASGKIGVEAGHDDLTRKALLRQRLNRAAGSAVVGGQNAGDVAETVFILPNNKNIIMAAQQVEGLTPKKVVVIPSKTVPQGVTAMLSFNPEGSVEENTEAMNEALGTVDTMQITYAARNSDFDGYDIHEGDYLAMYGSALFGTSRDIKVLLRSLAEKVHADGREFVTIYYGADITPKQAQKAADIFTQLCPRGKC